MSSHCAELSNCSIAPQAEYLSQIDRPDNPRSKILDDTQKETIFTMIDKDGDGEISFSEFQAVIPKGPPTMPTSKDMDSIFDDADQDGDGFWSKVSKQ